MDEWLGMSTSKLIDFGPFPLVEWRTKQGSTVTGSGCAPQTEALYQAAKFVHYYEIDDGPRMIIEMRIHGTKKWQKLKLPFEK